MEEFCNWTRIESWRYKSCDCRFCQEVCGFYMDSLKHLFLSWVNSSCDCFHCSGHGEWEDDTHTRCRILWRKPEQLASDIYTWAETNGYINNVCTVYELHSGEDVDGMSFDGCDEELLRRALAILEDQGKCTMFKGETSSEDGIKFF